MVYGVHSLKLTAIFAPKNGWLEYDPLLLGWPIFRGKLLVSGRVSGVNDDQLEMLLSDVLVCIDKCGIEIRNVWLVLCCRYLQSFFKPPSARGLSLFYGKY